VARELCALADLGPVPCGLVTSEWVGSAGGPGRRSSVSGDWLATDRADLAAERILDAAAELFAEQGVTTVGMADIAKAAGCSRATLYRYFDNRQAVRVAFVHRETRRIVARLAEQVRDIDDPAERVIAAMLGAVEQVRADPLLIAWFR